MNNIVKLCCRTALCIALVSSLCFSSALASMDFSDAYDNFEVSFSKEDTVLFETITDYEASKGKLIVTDPDKAVVYIGDFRGYYGGYTKHVKLLNPKEGTYNITAKIENMPPHKYAMSFKKVNPTPSSITNIIISTDDIPDGFDKIITLKYDTTKLELLDLCALSAPKEKDAGEIQSLGIELFASGYGKASFRVNCDDGERAKQILNVIQFRQLKDEPSYVTILTELGEEE